MNSSFNNWNLHSITSRQTIRSPQDRRRLLLQHRRVFLDWRFQRGSTRRKTLIMDQCEPELHISNLIFLRWKPEPRHVPKADSTLLWQYFISSSSCLCSSAWRGLKPLWSCSYLWFQDSLIYVDRLCNDVCTKNWERNLITSCNEKYQETFNDVWWFSLS